MMLYEKLQVIDNNYKSISDVINFIKESRDELNQLKNLHKWNNVKPLRTPEILEKIEETFRFRIPGVIKAHIKKFNAGTPINNDYVNDRDPTQTVHRFGGFLSFNNGDPDCFHDALKYFKVSDDELSLFPFGMDLHGNYICLNKQEEVVFYDKEKHKETFIAPTFINFMNRLYSENE